jgi:phage baseplate assembly protein gpV
MELSHLHFHSWGLVAENAAIGQQVVSVVPVEYRFGHKEVVIDNPQEDVVTYPSEDGMETVKVFHNGAVPCQWLNLNGNRVTPPNVRRNDDVIILRMGNTDQYYWMDFNIANVKRLETAVWAWSGDPNNPIKDDLSNAYRLEISTHGGLVTFTTSRANGEPFGYVHQFNTKDGKVVLEDTAGNRIYMDSSRTDIGMINADKTFLRLNRKNIEAYAPDSIHWTAVKHVSFKCQTMSIQAADSLKIKTNDFLADTPVATFTGLVKADSMSCTNGGQFGSVDASGAINAKSMTADTANFKSHGPH